MLDHPEVKIKVHFRIISRVMDAICFSIFYGKSYIIAGNTYLRPVSTHTNFRITNLSRLLALWKFIRRFKEIPGLNDAMFISLCGDWNHLVTNKFFANGKVEVEKYYPSYFKCPIEYLMKLGNLIQVNHVTNPHSNQLIVNCYSSENRCALVENYSGVQLFKKCSHHVPILIKYNDFPMPFSFPFFNFSSPA